MSLYFFQCLGEVVDEVVDVFGPYRQAYGSRENFLFLFFAVGQLRVGGRCRVDNQRFHIGYVGEQREYFEIVDKAVSFGFAAVDFEGKYRTGAVGEVAFVKRMVGVVSAGWFTRFTLG